jgi:uncharacterized phage protein (TIGR02220 family)
MSEREKVYVPNTFPTPNVLVDRVMPVVTASAFKILIAINRHTLGWGGDNLDKAIEIGIGGELGLKKLTGLSHQGIINGVRELLKLELISVKKAPRNSRTPNQYALNLDLTIGQLVKNLDQSKYLTSLTSQKFVPVLVKKVDSLKINPIKHNKSSGADTPGSPDGSPLPFDSAKSEEKKDGARRRAVGGGVPVELQPMVSRVIARMNELAGTSYKPESKIVLKGLVPRLKAGATERDCIVVVEDRWREWGNDSGMRQYFNPETLFRESNFEKYLNAARMTGRNGRAAGGFVG